MTAGGTSKWKVAEEDGSVNNFGAPIGRQLEDFNSWDCVCRTNMRGDYDRSCEIASDGR
jgi:hypothetical protein